MSTEASARAVGFDEREGLVDGADEGPLRSLASAMTSPRGFQPRAANGRFIRPPDELPADRFLEREISWLQLNERVLQLAMDADNPLLERAKFLAIFSSNLDEFFMIRVAGLKRRIATGIAVRFWRRSARSPASCSGCRPTSSSARSALRSRRRASPSCGGGTSPTRSA